jgi:hypothetical protein
MVSPSMDGGMAKVFYNTVPSIVRLDAIEPMPTVGAQIWWNTPADGLRIGGSVFYGSAIELRTTTLGLIQNMELLDFTMFQGSVEYSWKSWTFQGEYMARSQHTHGGATINGDSWYVGASRRFSKWFEAGVYYTEYYGDVTQRENSLQYQKDAALSLRFDVTDWWIMKVEGHCIRGTGLLFDNATNPVQNNDTWFMLALKTTFCF